MNGNVTSASIKVEHFLSSLLKTDYVSWSQLILFVLNITSSFRERPYTNSNLIGMTNSGSLPIITKTERCKALFVSRFSPEATGDDVEKFLKEQLRLKKLVCTRLKTKFNTYASFHVEVTDDEFSLINSTDVWPIGCLIAPFYGKLTTDQVHSCLPIMGDSSVTNILHKERGGSPHPLQ
jgi:hypothetical protein